MSATVGFSLAALEMDVVTTPVAVAAATSPAWLPFMQTISEAAALLLPILGVCWLTVQIVVKIAEARRNRLRDEDG